MSYNFESKLFNEACLKIEKNQTRNLNLSKQLFSREQIQKLAALLKMNKSVISLDLSNSDLSAEDIKYIADALLVNTVLTDLNLQSNKIREGISHLTIALSKNRTLKKLRLDNNFLGFHPKAIKEICEILSQNKSLTSLNLSSNNFSNKNIELFFGALKRNTSLTEVDLSGNPLVNTEVLKTIDELFSKNKTLVSLNLISDNVSKPITVLEQNRINRLQSNKTKTFFVYFVIDWLEKNKIRSMEVLENLLSFLGYEFVYFQKAVNFYDVMHGEEYDNSNDQLKMIKSNKLRDYSFSKRGFNNSRIIRLAKELSEIETIGQLDLNSNEFGLFGLNVLLEALKSKQIQSLILSRNNFSFSFPIPLTAFPFPGSLTVLNLEACKLQPEGILLLAGGLFHSDNRSLVELNLRDNNIAHRFSHLIMALVKIPTLKYLNLGRGNLNYSTFTKDFRNLMSNKKLRSLSLAGNNLSADQIGECSHVLNHMKSLTSINLKGNIMHSSVTIFRDMVFGNPNLLYIQFPKPDFMKFLGGNLDKNEVIGKIDEEIYKQKDVKDILLSRRKADFKFIALLRKNKISGLLLKHLLEYVGMELDRFNDVIFHVDSTYNKTENKKKRGFMPLKKTMEEEAMLRETKSVLATLDLLKKTKNFDEGDEIRQEISEAFDALEGKRSASKKPKNKGDKCLVQ